MSESGGESDRKRPSRHVLLVLDPDTAEAEEIAEAIRTFGSEGSVLTVATERARPPRASPGSAQVRVDLALEDVHPEDYDLPVVVGGPAATARLLQHPIVKRAFENLQASQWDRRVKTALLRVSHATTRAPTDEAFAEAGLDACADILADPVGLMVLRNHERGRLRVAATRNAPADLVASVRAGLTGRDAKGCVATALRERRVVHCTNGQERLPGLPLHEHDPWFVVAAPLRFPEDEEPAGVLVVGSRDAFTPQDRERVELVATECADALHRRELMHRVESLARERGVALARLQLAHAELEDFAYSVSHDLSEPLRGIVTLTSYVRGDLHGKVPADDEEMLAKIEAAGLQLKDMVAGLLAVTRAMKSTAPGADGGRGIVDVRELAESCVVTLAPSLEEKGARLELLTDLPVVPGERAAFEQILLNLVTNALKHNDKAEPWIGIGCEDAGNEWRFFVRDNGPGIPPEYHERVFRVYARLPVSEPSGGVGVGLALVRKLVHRQGGRVWVESEPGAGATFYFTAAKLAEDAPDDPVGEESSTLTGRAA